MPVNVKKSTTTRKTTKRTNKKVESKVAIDKSMESLNMALQMDVETFKEKIVYRLRTTVGTSVQKASNLAWWQALVGTVNEIILERLTQTQLIHATRDTRAVHYMSAEFLMGRLTVNNLCNLELFNVAKQALNELGLDLNDICEQEPDMALGNGGLGRLAACFIDSLATLSYPSVGYGIHYENGLFRQEIRAGKQVERPDSWREYGCPWEVCRPESVQQVQLGGYVETRNLPDGSFKKIWHPNHIIKGVPWDIPVVGYRGSSVTILRLWESRATESFDWDVFNAGGYVDAQDEKAAAETISKVLYPNDSTEAGKILRLTQQYFFTACSLKDILRRYNRTHNHDYSKFVQKVAIQLNDTHPVIAIAELIRLLVDEDNVGFDEALDMVEKIFAYTNHTLLPEALEKWPVYLFEKLLPRHLEIIYEINMRFLNNQVDKMWPNDDSKKAQLSIIQEGPCKMVRMAHLAVICSSYVNGVAQIHSDLVKNQLFKDFAKIYPKKFTNVTNGVTPRRWLLACNMGLAKLYTKYCSDKWPVDLNLCKKLKDYAADKAVQQEFMSIKKANKQALALEIKKLVGLDVSADAIFDVQVKRLHEYKRQHLNLLYIIYLYQKLLKNPDLKIPSQVFIFGAKAAPAYTLAKDIIYAINMVGQKINNDHRIKNMLKVVFLPNYRVSLAEKIIPAADISEQISTAGYEASGTSNMKFSINGALTLGTMDGANIEIVQEAGEENNFIFGLSVKEVQELKEKGYNPYDYYNSNKDLKNALDLLDTDFFTPGEQGALSSIKRSLLEGGDPYLVLADFDSYVKAHQRAEKLYTNKSAWAKAAIINSASMGKFSSDRAIEDYVKNIWSLKSYDVK